MKRIVLFATLVTFFACQNVEQYRAGIEDLSAKWETTATSVEEFSEMLNTEISGHGTMVGSMNVEETVFTSLPADAQAKVADAKKSCVEAGQSYAEIQEEVTQFMTEWTAKTAELTALQEGLAQGQLSGDVAAQIAELTTFLEGTGAYLTDWNAAFASAKENCTTSHSQYAAVLAEVMPSQTK